MYTETIETVDLPNAGRKKLAVTREYQTAEAAKASDVEEFHDYALALAAGKFVVFDEQYLDKPDHSDPDNRMRVWMFGA